MLEGNNLELSAQIHGLFSCALCFCLSVSHAVYFNKVLCITGC